MQSKSLFTIIALAAVALAGCADDPATGTVKFERSGFAPEHMEVAIEYIESENPYAPGPPDADPVQGPVSGVLCTVADTVTGAAPVPLPVCVSPGTLVTATFHGLPEPTGDGYTLYFLGASDIMIGSLSGDTENGYTLEAAFEDYLADDVNGTELRMGDFVVASGAASGGANNLEAAFAPAAFDGTFEGDTLTIDIPALPEGAAYEGWLVTVAEDGTKTHDRSFAVTGGTTVTHTAPETIDMWQEFHIHVTGSSLNLGIGPVRLAA